MSLLKLAYVIKGGSGSGNFGHGGRPGKVGGSRSQLPPLTYAPSLDDADKAAVKEYSFRAYKTLNKKLRNGSSLDESERNLVNTLDDVISSAPDVKASKVYRAMQRTPEELGMQVGQIYTEPAYLSTTYDASYMYKLGSENDLKTRITIKVPKGTPGVYTEKVSYKPKEKEVLFGRNSAMKVTAITRDEFGNVNVTAELV